MSGVTSAPTPAAKPPLNQMKYPVESAGGPTYVKITTTGTPTRTTAATPSTAPRIHIGRRGQPLTPSADLGSGGSFPLATNTRTSGVAMNAVRSGSTNAVT